MEKWDELAQKEHKLLEKEEKLMEEKRKLERVKDIYDEHLYKANRFMDELGYMFHKNEEHYKYEGMINEFFMESRKAREHLEDSTEELHQQKRKIYQAIDDVAYEKKKALLAEKEVANEH